MKLLRPLLLGALLAGAFFYFTTWRHEGSPLVFDGKRWDQWVDLWLQRMPPLGAFANPEGLATDYAALSAADYLGSSSLDLEHLSLARPR